MHHHMHNTVGGVYLLLLTVCVHSDMILYSDMTMHSLSGPISDRRLDHRHHAYSLYTCSKLIWDVHSIGTLIRYLNSTYLEELSSGVLLILPPSTTRMNSPLACCLLHSTYSSPILTGVVSLSYLRIKSEPCSAVLVPRLYIGWRFWRRYIWQYE